MHACQNRINKRRKPSISQMAKRVTIMLDDALAKKLREIQSKQIREQSKSVSFSKVINAMIHESLKKK